MMSTINIAVIDDGVSNKIGNLVFDIEISQDLKVKDNFTDIILNHVKLMMNS